MTEMTKMRSDTPLNQLPAEAKADVVVVVEASAAMVVKDMAEAGPSAPASSSNTLDPRCRLLGNKQQFRNICVPLYEASIKGNWEAAEDIINKCEGVTGYYITENHETALHIAASAKGTKVMEEFVRKLVEKMGRLDLQLPNKSKNTALCLAAAGGNVNIAKIMVDVNDSLVNIPGSQDMMPLYIASLYGKREMVEYLYNKSEKMGNEVWKDDTRRGWVLLRCVEADFFDIAKKIVNDLPQLAKSTETLAALARKTEAFEEIKPHFIRRVINQIIHVQVARIEKESPATELLKKIWTYIMTNLEKDEVKTIIRGPLDVEGKRSSRVLFIAAEMGNTKFIVELIRQYPDLIWKVNDAKQSIFHIAVLHRHEGIYNLMYEIGSMKDFITPLRDEEDNNMLHLVSKSAKKKRPQKTSGVALQMQRELLWYKEVQRMLPRSCQEKKNKDGLLPHELFTNEHKDLMSASEKWMRDTASHCMVVAALIATVVFPAAFTVPGGYHNEHGYPILRDHRAFIIFAISDAISLTSAIISIAIFLYILTSRFAEEDFLESLPEKLMRGLAALFVSIIFMMIAFGASFFAVYDNKLIWVPTVITAFASIPVIFYAILQYGLLADVYHSTYGSKNIFKPKKSMLY